MARRRRGRRRTAREAFDALLAFFDTARAPGGEPCTFLLDEVLELRTFESFPGLRHVLRELLQALAESPQSLRADHALRRARASAAARRHGALRGDAPAAARAGDVTDLLAAVVQRLRADGRPTTATSSAAPCRR